jgi:hypothetical protein
MRFLRQNAIALLALAVALSGTAYAAKKIGPRDIQRNAIRSRHIKRGQVKWKELAGGLRGQLRKAATPKPPEQLQVIKVEGAPQSLAPGGFGGAPVATCPPGYAVVGTGFKSSLGSPGFVFSYGTFVGGFFSNDSSITIETRVQAICARNSGGGATASRAAGLRRFKRQVAQAQAEMQP